MAHDTILILGTFESNDPVHRATVDALHHAASKLGVVLNTRWMGPEDMQMYPGLVADVAAVILAPPPSGGGPLPAAFLPALEPIRKRGLPFLATGSAHVLVLVEIARNVLGLEGAGGSCFPDRRSEHQVVKSLADEIPQAARGSLRSVELRLVHDDRIQAIYGEEEKVSEVTDVMFSLNLDYATPLEEAGLIPVLLEPLQGRPYLHLLTGQDFHLTAAFLPQMRSSPDYPHPLISGLLKAATKNR